MMLYLELVAPLTRKQPNQCTQTIFPNVLLHLSTKWLLSLQSTLRLTGRQTRGDKQNVLSVCLLMLKGFLNSLFEDALTCTLFSDSLDWRELCLFLARSDHLYVFFMQWSPDMYGEGVRGMGQEPGFMVVKKNDVSETAEDEPITDLNVKEWEVRSTRLKLPRHLI